MLYLCFIDNIFFSAIRALRGPPVRNILLLDEQLQLGVVHELSCNTPLCELHV